MAYGHLSCPLEQLAITPVHLLPIAQHISAHPESHLAWSLDPKEPVFPWSF